MSDREEYLQRLKAKLDEWNGELERLEARARTAQADAKVQYQRQLEELRQNRNEMRRRYEEMEHASEAAWEQLRAGAEDAWRTLDEAFRGSGKKR